LNVTNAKITYDYTPTSPSTNYVRMYVCMYVSMYIPQCNIDFLDEILLHLPLCIHMHR